GFARGNNVGAQQASGEFVAFLNNDTRVDLDWLRHMVGAIRREEGIICAGARILDWGGRLVDFVGGKINFHGHGFQLDFGAPNSERSYMDERLIPFSCGGAMLIDRQIFLESGGFDEDYFAFFEDVDLGWRLWLLGYKVIFAPKAIVYHKHHGTSRRMPLYQLRVLYERNALYTIIKNYEQQNLDKVLPLSLFLLIKRALLNFKIEEKDWLLDSRRDGRVVTQLKVPRLGLSYLIGAEQVVANLPKLMEKRESIQQMRKRTDEEIFELFHFKLTDPIFPGQSYVKFQDTLVNTLGLPAVFTKPLPCRVLIVSHDVVGPNMAGPGMRYWEIAKALSREFEVTLACPGEPRLSSPNFRVKGYSRSDEKTLIHLVNSADVVLAFGYLLHELPLLGNLGKPLIVDIYVPFILENLEIHSQLSLPDQNETNDKYLRILNNQLRLGDFYICASERQRDFWLGMLAANGRINPSNYAEDKSMRSLIDVVPIGMPAEPPQHRKQVLKGVYPNISSNDKVIIWAGGIWDWFDPLTLIQAVARITRHRDDVKLFFMGTQHMDPSIVPEMHMSSRAIRLSQELGLYDKHVFFNRWVPYEERENYLLEADIGTSLHFDYVETRFAFRTRLIDYIWAGLPILTTRGDYLSDLVEEEGLGRLVDPGDVEQLVAVLTEMLDTPDLREKYRANFERVAARFTWDKAVEPLARFLRNPQRAPDRANYELNLALNTPESLASVVPTPLWQLPLKAWQRYRSSGLAALWQEIRQYILWRLER
ncbi:MAG: glycosyltransferase, partial [Chloroflexi bacterium]|nr:glycosyltransferase [Chloroflexota bacterium]